MLLSKNLKWSDPITQFTSTTLMRRLRKRVSWVLRQFEYPMVSQLFVTGSLIFHLYKFDYLDISAEAIKFSEKYSSWLITLFTIIFNDLFSLLQI